MSQYPNPNDPPGYYQPLPPQRTSGAAIASLVLGIMGCVPVITGILAIVFGLVGLNAARKNNVGGRGLAIAGLILGIASIISWTGIGGMIGMAYYETGPSRMAAQTFVTDLSNGDVNSAAVLCVPETSKDSLQTTTDQFKALGPLIRVRFFAFKVVDSAGTSTRLVVGGARFANVTRTVKVTFVIQPDGSELIKSWEIH